MKYYLLMLDSEEGTEEDAICSIEENYSLKYSVEKDDLYKGEVVNNWNSSLKFIYDSKEGSKLTDYLATNIDWPIVSPKFRTLIESGDSANIQFLPITLMEKNSGQENHGYSIMNIIGLTNALDIPNSVHFWIQANDIKMLSIIKYALKESALGGRDIIRLQEEYLSLSVFVSEALYKRIKQNKITGCYFQPVKVTY